MRGGTVRRGTGAWFAITGVALLRDRMAWTTITDRITKITENTTLRISVRASCPLICHHQARRPPPSAFHRRLPERRPRLNLRPRSIAVLNARMRP